MKVEEQSKAVKQAAQDGVKFRPASITCAEISLTCQMQLLEAFTRDDVDVDAKKVGCADQILLLCLGADSQYNTSLQSSNVFVSSSLLYSSPFLVLTSFVSHGLQLSSLVRPLFICSLLSASFPSPMLSAPGVAPRCRSWLFHACPAHLACMGSTQVDNLKQIVVEECIQYLQMDIGDWVDPADEVYPGMQGADQRVTQTPKHRLLAKLEKFREYKNRAKPSMPRTYHGLSGLDKSAGA